jgi:hypothetical protein
VGSDANQDLKYLMGWTERLFASVRAPTTIESTFGGQGGTLSAAAVADLDGGASGAQEAADGAAAGEVLGQLAAQSQVQDRDYAATAEKAKVSWADISSAHAILELRDW